MSKKSYRKNVGIMVINKKGEVFVAHRTDNREKAWQMPQGGIDESEGEYEAALRELYEETGLSNVAFITKSQHWYAYDFPENVHFTSKKKKLYIGQTQKWFLVEFLGDDSEINLGEKHAEFDQWKWVQPETLVDMIVLFKKEVYQQVVEEFLPFIERFKASRTHDYSTR